MFIKRIVIRIGTFLVLCCFLAIYYSNVNNFNPKSTIQQFLRKSENADNCIKSSNTSTYKVCKSLPYSDIKCGNANTQVDSSGKTFVVPNVVFFVWFGYNLTFKYYNYLALRSVASVHRPERIDFYYSKGLPIGNHWERAVREIPCLQLIRIDEPTHALGVEMPDVVRRTNLARLNILMEHGGIYLDGDVITLKSLDPLRVYPATLGRSSEKLVCICSVLARKNSLFLQEYFQEFPKHFDSKQPCYFTTKYIYQFVQKAQVKVHVEETSMNRPNPHDRSDGVLSTTFGHYDLSNNYMLHIHPKRVIKAIGSNWTELADDELRTLDGAYGEAARVALFGSPDLVFKSGEETFEMSPKEQIREYDAIVQKNATIEDDDTVNIA